MANKVELYDGATLLGTDNAPTVVSGTVQSFSIPFTATAGAKALTAKFYIDDVLQGTSSVRNIAVNAQVITATQMFPSASETDVEIERAPSVTFDEAVVNMDGTAITDANASSLITLKETNASGIDVPFTTEVIGNSISIIPSSPLKYSQTYYIAVSDVKSVANGTVIAGTSHSFTTKAEVIVANPLKSTTGNVFNIDTKETINGVDAQTLAHNTSITALNDTVGTNDFVWKEGTNPVVRAFKELIAADRQLFWGGDEKERPAYFSAGALGLENVALFTDEATIFFVGTVVYDTTNTNLPFSISAEGYAVEGTQNLRGIMKGGLSSSTASGTRVFWSTSALNQDNMNIGDFDTYKEAQIITIKKTATAAEYRLNGTLIATKTGTQSLAQLFHYLGGGLGLYFKGTVNVFSAFNRALGTTEVDSIETYLKNRFHRNLTPKLRGGINTTSTSYMFFHIYKASDFPELTTVKPYFAIYANDHGLESGATVGPFWADFDDLSLTNFTERGLIQIPNAQLYESETPYLVRDPNAVDGKTLHIFWHTTTTDPENADPTIMQETRLAVSAGGLELHNIIDWQDLGNPLGRYEGETHLGYLQVPTKRADGTFVGYHAVGGSGSALDGQIGMSTSTDLRAWTRGYVANNIGLPEGWITYANRAKFFTYNGEEYCIGPRVPEIGYDNLSSNAWKIALFKAKDGVPVSWVRDLYPYMVREMSCYVEGTTAVILFTMPKQKLFMEHFDLTTI